MIDKSINNFHVTHKAESCVENTSDSHGKNGTPIIKQIKLFRFLNTTNIFTLQSNMKIKNSLKFIRIKINYDLFFNILTSLK